MQYWKMHACPCPTQDFSQNPKLPIPPPSFLSQNQVACSQALCICCLALSEASFAVAVQGISFGFCTGPYEIKPSKGHGIRTPPVSSSVLYGMHPRHPKRSNRWDPQQMSPVTFWKLGYYLGRPSLASFAPGRVVYSEVYQEACTEFFSLQWPGRGQELVPGAQSRKTKDCTDPKQQKHGETQARVQNASRKGSRLCGLRGLLGDAGAFPLTVFWASIGTHVSSVPETFGKGKPVLTKGGKVVLLVKPRSLQPVCSKILK